MRSDVSRPTKVPSTDDHPLDLWVVGHTNLDQFLRVRQLPQPDRTVPITGRETRLGGTAANIALASAAWGVRTGLISRVGPDFPPELRQRLSGAGIDLRGLDTVPATPSSACFIAEDGRGGQMTLIDQGPMGDAVPYRVPERLLADAPWVHLTTGSPRFLLALKASALRAGARVAVDPAQEIHYRWNRRDLIGLLSGAEILFGNHHEIDRVRSLVGARRVDELLERVPLVVRTDGADGATAFRRTGVVRVAADRPRRLRQP